MALYRFLYWSAYGGWIAVLVRVANKINREVPEPYMDEIFHVPQAQAYCRGEWAYWNGALTTPPGLYLVPAALANAERWLQRALPEFRFVSNPCSLDSLRFLNLAILGVLPLLYSSTLLAVRKSKPHTEVGSKLKSTRAKEERAERKSARWEGLVIALMPVVGWWGWLYYTDLGSVAMVLLALRLSLARRHFPASVLGAGSLLFRQTNVVWIAFVAGVAVVRELRTVSCDDRVKKRSRLHDPLLEHARLADLIRTPLSLVSLTLDHFSTVFPIVAAYLPVFVGFLVFIKLNGGIVLGDKSNHVATVHIAQVYYFVAFSAAFLSPHILGLRNVKKSLSSLFGTTTRAAASLSVLAGIVWTIRHFTIAHPFLLADNRHFAFYVWRRVVNFNPLARYALAPGYLFAFRIVYQALVDSQTMRLSTFVLFTISTALVLVPTPLIEPRYFLTPFLILRLYLAPSPSPRQPLFKSRRRSGRRVRLVLEAVLYVSVQTTCIWLFLEKSFEWSDIEIGPDGKGLRGRDAREVGKRQRFMW